MAVSLFSPSRCVLLLNDEGLAIFNATGGKAVLVDSVPWETEGFEESVAEIISRKCRSRPVLVLNDMVEQHYRKGRVPKVSPFDRANIIKRRLSAAFPSYAIRAAIKTKDKSAPRTDDKVPSGDIYLFAAVPLTENVRRTLAAVQASHAPIAGFCLLPVESASMVHTLSRKIAKGGDKGAIWTVFVGQHQSGGLRQIVTKNGELALTRMTPIIDTDIDADIWVNEVAGELRGTMSYLSRFGYDPTDGLDVIIISNNSAADRMAAKIDFECNLNVMTAAEAANLLGIGLGRQQDQRYADPLHVGWSGRKGKFTLPLQSPQLDKISSPSRMAAAASFILLLACAYFGYVAFNEMSAWRKNSEDYELAQQRLSVLRLEHAEEVERKRAIGVDFVLIENSTKIYAGLERGAMRPLSLIDRVGDALGNDIKLASLSIKPAGSIGTSVTPDAPADAGNQDLPPPDYETVLRIVFPGTLDPEIGVRKINELEQRLKAAMPSHDISIIKQVADLSYTGNFVGESTSAANQGNGQTEDFEAQIMIRGTLL